MKNDIVLSIIVPVYNVEKYLDECLESIIKNYDQKSYFDKVNRYFERYPLYDDGNASKRVVDWLEKKIKEK